MQGRWADGIGRWFRVPSTPPIAAMQAEPGQIAGLNGWRALCVLLVLVTHTLGHTGLGNFGVLVFFVISGFLITRLFLVEFNHTGSVAIGDFYRRRIIRLYPAILTYTTAVVIAYVLWVPGRFSPQEPACALLYCENYLVVHRELLHQMVTMPFAGFWSLSIEEQFYILFPALLLFALRLGGTRHLLWLAAVATFVPLGVRLLYAAIEPQLLLPAFSHVIYASTETRIDSIGAGVLLAAACETVRGRAIVRVLMTPLPVALALAAILVWHLVPAPVFRETIGYTVLNAAAAVLLCATMFSSRYGTIGHLLNLRISDWFGRLSYSIYVWHFGILDLTFYALPLDDRWLRLLAVAALTPVVACASYYGPEAWARRWRSAESRRNAPQSSAYTFRV